MQKHYQIAIDLVWEFFDDKAIIFLMENETFLTVNKTSILLIRLLGRKFPKSFHVGNVARVLQQHYELSPGEVSILVRSILHKWVKCGILIEVKK